MAKTIDQIAQEVVKGQWGSGDVRKKKLIAAGYDYEAVQKRVNELLKPYQNLNAKNYISDVVKIGQATSNERGGLGGGVAGDQTKKEVAITNWSYSSGNKYNSWKYVFRAKDTSARLKIAQAAIDACNNNHIGYDVNSPDRKSCFKAAAKVNFDLSKITTNCELTCSELANVCIAAAGLKSYLSVSQPAYVETLTKKLNASTEFIKYTDSAYTNQSKNLLPGDILISGSHAAIVIKTPKRETTGGNTVAKKDTTTIAKEVIAGKWGTGEERKKKLKAAGYNYDTVQKKVNELLAPKKKSVDTIAQEVINGKWGSGDDRKKKLVAAGYDYNAVQKRVNELLAKKTSVKKTYTGKLPTTTIKKTNAEVIRDTIKWAKWIAADNSFHYGYTNKHGSSNPAKWNPNAHHNGCYFCGTNTTSGGRSKKGIVDYKKTYCCNPFVGAAWAHGGCVPTALSLCQNGDSWGFSKNNGYNTSKLFTNLGHPKKSSLKPGDVLCKNTHVALYVGDGKIAEAGNGDDNVRNSSKWNNSIHVTTLTDKNYSSFSRVHRFNSSVNTTISIRHGEVSDRVKLWQAFLNWYNGKNVCTVDGCFGDSTLKYTKAFQEKELGKGQGDGLVGPKTLAAAAKCKK